MHKRTVNEQISLLMLLQVRYAACDALAAVLVFISMVRMKVVNSASDDYSSIAVLAKSLCQGIIDLRYSAKTSDGHNSSEKVGSFLCGYFVPLHWQLFFCFPVFDLCHFCVNFCII